MTIPKAITRVRAQLTFFIISALSKRRAPHLPPKLKPTDASVRAKGPYYVQHDGGAPNLATQNKSPNRTTVDVVRCAIIFAITKPVVYF
jgi:hypothetical protein